MAPADRLDLERQAREYLARQLSDRVPEALIYEGRFAEQPLPGEGVVAAFSFRLSSPAALKPACHETAPDGDLHYVFVGETTPNYFPAYGLLADDAYSVHVGTRFMLEMPIRRVDDSVEPPDARRRLDDTIREVAPDAGSAADVWLAALFAVGGDLHAVYRLRLGGEELYCMGGDCPPGFYRMTNYPPQAAYRLHLGKLIRAEARESQE